MINCLRKAAQRLNGRAREDCIRFAQDCHANPDADLSQAQSYIRVHLPSASAASCRTPTSANILHLNRELALGRNNFIQSEASTSLKNNLINSIQPWKVVTGASSDILNLAWSPSGESFAFGSATLSDEYNRAGNLILGSLEPLKVKMLHGHQVPRLNPLPTQDPWLHSTVSSVGYSARSGILFSGSYDRYVRSWHPEAGVCLGNRLFADEVVTLVVHPIQDVVAVGCKDGSLELTTWDENGSYESSWKCTPLRTNNSREKLYPSCLSWQAGCQNKLIAGYDNLVQNSNAGSLVLFDGTTGQQFHKVQPGSTRHFDLCSHPYGLFAVACSARTSKSGSVRSHIRMFEQKSTGAVADFDADSCQVDINRVTIS